MIGFTTQVHMVMAILASVKESRDGASANNYVDSGAKKLIYGGQAAVCGSNISWF